MHSHFQPVDLRHACRLINHGPTVLVTSRHGGRRNVMAAAWSMPVEFEPPRVAVVIDKKTLTRELAAASGGFGLCIPGAALAELTYGVGSVSGRDVDKFDRFGIAAGVGPVLGVPVIETDCSAWLECRLIPERHTEDAYDTCFAGGRGRRSARVRTRTLAGRRRPRGTAQHPSPRRRQFRARRRDSAGAQALVLR